MSEEIKRGPGRPRKTQEEPMESVHEVKLSPAVAAPQPKADAAPKMFKFKLLKGTNFPNNADFRIVDVDEDGVESAPRVAGEGEFGPHSKIKPGTVVLVNAYWAKRFKEFKIADRIEEFE